MSSYANIPLDDAWLFDSDDSDLDDFHDNDDSKPDFEPDFEPDSINDMLLPPENFYATEEDMFQDIQAWAAQYKYAFQRGRSKPIGKHWKKFLYQCDCCRPIPVENCL
jgi:hypothetical protein